MKTKITLVLLNFIFITSCQKNYQEPIATPDKIQLTNHKTHKNTSSTLRTIDFLTSKTWKINRYYKNDNGYITKFYVRDSVNVIDLSSDTRTYYTDGRLVAVDKYGTAYNYTWKFPNGDETQLQITFSPTDIRTLRINALSSTYFEYSQVTNNGTYFTDHQ